MKNIKIWAILLTITLVCGGCTGQSDASLDKTTEEIVTAQAEQSTEDKTATKELEKETGTEQEPNPSVDPLQEYWEKTADVLSKQKFMNIMSESTTSLRRM